MMENRYFQMNIFGNYTKKIILCLSVLLPLNSFAQDSTTKFKYYYRPNIVFNYKDGLYYYQNKPFSGMDSITDMNLDFLQLDSISKGHSIKSKVYIRQPELKLYEEEYFFGNMAYTYSNNDTIKYISDITTHGLESIDNYSFDSTKVGLRVDFNKNGTVSNIYNVHNGFIEGTVYKFDTNGKLFMQMEYKHNHPFGSLISWYSNGRMASISNYIDEHIRTGYAKYWYPNGNIKAILKAGNSVKKDTSKYFDTTGSLTKEEYSDTGKGLYKINKYHDGRFYESGIGEWYFLSALEKNFAREDVYEMEKGKWTYYDDKGKIIKELFIKDKKVIEVKEYNSNGKLIKDNTAPTIDNTEKEITDPQFFY